MKRLREWWCRIRHLGHRLKAPPLDPFEHWRCVYCGWDAEHLKPWRTHWGRQ
jgi:hypothetical protein